MLSIVVMVFFALCGFVAKMIITQRALLRLWKTSIIRSVKKADFVQDEQKHHDTAESWQKCWC